MIIIMANMQFSVALNLLTKNFKQGANEIKTGLRNIQMQAMTMFAALGAGSLGLSELVSNLISTARETSRVSTSLKNVSGDSATFVKSQKFLIDLSQKYGLYINDLVGNFAGFSAAAKASNVSMKDQQKIFESLSRAAVSFGMSSDQSNGMFLAVQQMMSKGKVSAEELRGQLGERLPIAMAAMAKAAGVTVSGLDAIMKKSELMSADVLPKFADALNEMVTNVNTDNIESSFNRLKNKFKELTDALSVGNIYKALLDQTNSAFGWIMSNLKSIGDVLVNIVGTLIIGKIITFFKVGYASITASAEASYIAQAIAGRKASLQQYFDLQGLTKKAAAEKVKQALDNEISYARQAFAARKFSIIAITSVRAVGVALKSMLLAFAPMLIISGLIAIWQHFSNIAAKAKEIKAIWTDYQNGLKNAGNNSAGTRDLKAQIAFINNQKNSLEERKVALTKINEILGTNYKYEKDGLTINGDINSKIKERFALLKAQAEYQYSVNEQLKNSDKLTESNNKRSEAEDKLKENNKIINDYNKKYPNATKNNIADVDRSWTPEMIIKTFGSLAEREKLGSAYGSNRDINSIYGDLVKENQQLKKVDIDATNNQIAILAKLEKDVATGGSVGSGGEETDIKKIDDTYLKEKESIENRFNNKQIKTILEKNKLIDDLNKKSFEKYAVFSKSDLSKSKYYTNVKTGAENPLISKNDSEYNKVVEDYNKELILLTQEAKIKGLSENELTQKTNELKDKTVDNISSIVDLTDSQIKYSQDLFKSKVDLKTKKEKKDELKSYEYVSPFDNVGKTEIETAQANFDKAREEYDKFVGEAGELTDELIKEINNKFSNVVGLDKALKLLEVKKQVEDLQTELNKGLYGGVKEIANSAKNMYEGWKAVVDTINSVDATEWEKFLSIWDALTNTIDNILSIVKFFTSLNELIVKLTKSKSDENRIDKENNTILIEKIGLEIIEKGVSKTSFGVNKSDANTKPVDVAGNLLSIGSSLLPTVAPTSVDTSQQKSTIAANTGVAVSGAIASASVLPFPFNLIEMAAAALQVYSLLSSLPKFADGGIVGGSSFTGDKILAGLNSGELILNQQQQNKLLNNSSTGVGGEVKFVIEGKNLVGAINNYNKIKGKVK